MVLISWQVIFITFFLRPQQNRRSSSVLIMNGIQIWILSLFCFFPFMELNEVKFSFSIIWRRSQVIS